MSAIKVCVRMRPLFDARKEKWAGGLETHGRRIVLGTKTYDPDVTLGINSTQTEVFAHATPILDSVKEGNNGTLLVYGQTGTGKTHTMIGGDGVYDGVAIRSIEYLLEHVREETIAGKQMALAMSVLEVYNERITDMLAPDVDAEVTLVNGFPRSTTQVTLASLDSATSTVERALKSRHVSETAMNDRSSRSHVIFMLDLIEQIGERTEISHLFLVDLAGSESIKKSEASGKAVREAGMINKSLLALKHVIITLSAQDASSRGHVPYRDSRLTELLQDSIGGTARTMFIACISANGRDVEETKSTLEYATKARSIRNVSNTERDKLQVRCRGLEMELLKYRNRLERTAAEKGGCWISKEEHDKMGADAEELRSLRETVAQLHNDTKIAKASTTVKDSEIALLREIVGDKERSLERSKISLARAVQQIHQSTVNMEGDISKRLANLRNCASADAEAAGRNLKDLMVLLESDDVAMASVPELDAMWQRVNQRHDEALTSVTNAVGELERSVLQRQQDQTRAVNKLMADAVKHISECANRTELTFASTNQDLRDDFNAATSRAEVARKSTTDLAEREAAANVARATARHARDLVAAVPTPDMSDATTDAIASCNTALRSKVTTIARTALSSIKGIDLPPELARPNVPLAVSVPLSPIRPSAAVTASDDNVTDAQSDVDPANFARQGLPPPGRRPQGSSLPLHVRHPSTNNSQQPKRSRSRATDAGLEASRQRRGNPSAPAK